MAARKTKTATSSGEELGLKHPEVVREALA